MNGFENTILAEGSAFRGKVLMGSLPEFGQLNPLLAIAEQLLARGHDVHFASGSSCAKRMSAFNAGLAHFPDTAATTLHFHTLGDEGCINDHNYMASASAAEFADYKAVLAQGPRNYAAFNRLITLVMQGSLEGRKAVTDKFIDLIAELQPDILVLDQFTSCLVEAARVTGVDYIITAPASPATLSSPSPFKEPLSGTDLEAPMSLKSTLLNVWYFANLVPRVINHPALLALRAYRLDVLKLTPISKAIDSSPFSKFHPSWTNQRAIISPNIDFRQQTPFDKVIFVGACTQRRAPAAPNPASEDAAVKAWLDDALRANDSVVYLNMGTIFRYNQSEIDAITGAARLLAAARPGSRGVRFLWKVPKGDFDLGGLPANVKLFGWLDDVDLVYGHAAVKAALNHGGGNSFNEALTARLPQLVCAQWFDTIDYGVAARAAGIGLSSAHPGRLDARDIAEKVGRLLTERGFAEKVGVWALKSRAAGGARAAADVVEGYLEGKWRARDGHLVDAPASTDKAPVAPPKRRVARALFLLFLAGLLFNATSAGAGWVQALLALLPARA
ncbi:hypothetical protein HWV62_16718 [Athelia sp. TMB]|nr:hypothetical protein HWV62_16718 [Athelia sp. TMB]